MSIPKSLYVKINNYLSDLIAQGWIEKSHSSYTSPVISKEEVRLFTVVHRLQLNRKTHHDSQPIPRVHDIMDGCQETPSIADTEAVWNQIETKQI